MLHGATTLGVAGSDLTHLLARLAGAPPTTARPVFADRLGQWLGWTGAISLSTALNAQPAAPQPGRALGGEQADFQRVSAALAASIAAGTREPAVSLSDFGPHRRHCLVQQQVMEEAVAALRQRLRDALARQSSQGARLAAIDTVVDQGLALHERALLGLVPLRLQTHFEQLQRAARLADADGSGDGGDGGAATPQWCEVYRQDMSRVLSAELAHRLLPARGLLDALLAPQPT